MKGLSKEQRATRAALEERLGSAKAGVEAAVKTYSEVLEDVRQFRESIVEEAQGYFDDRSETWQEGERGEACQSWIDEWSGAELEDMETPDTAHSDTVSDLPDQPE